MFGDYGHGSLILLVGLILTFFNDYLKKTALAPVLPMRYVLLMMGMSSVYNGLIYNEFFAIPNDWFGSCYDLSVRN
jgi:V-type H+-transporting ATPase subunit a